VNYKSSLYSSICSKYNRRMQITLVTFVKMLSWLVLRLVAVCKDNDSRIQHRTTNNTKLLTPLTLISPSCNKEPFRETWSRSQVGRYDVLCNRFEFLSYVEFIRVFLISRTQGPHGGDYEDGCLLGRSAVYSTTKPSEVLAASIIWAIIALIMVAASTYETLVDFYQTKRR
jgi:hypothetical protein